MVEYIIRPATVNDALFLANTVIEAEKSGTDRLSYSIIFGLTEDEVRKYLIQIFEEDIEGCELSVSSFLVAESNGEVVAALSAWVEALDGTPSTIIKGNLLNYTLPNECIKKAISLNKIISGLHVEYLPNTIQVGACYVLNGFRGNGILGALDKEIIDRLVNKHASINSVMVQIFSCNTSSIKAFKKSGFNLVKTKKSDNKEINNYLPSNTKFVFKKNINQ